MNSKTLKTIPAKYRTLLFAAWITFILCLKTQSGLTQVLPKETQSTPNIILIFADDMGWADVGYIGFDNTGFYETPHIDRLASEGMIFNRFYPAAANCAPSRASLLTGMYTPRHHVYLPQGYSRGGSLSSMRWKTPTHNADDSFFDTFQVNVNHVDPEFESLAELLKKGGYVTARLGKWHIGDDNQGFDLSSAEGTPNYVTNLHGQEQRFYRDTTVAERLTDAAIDFMFENRDKPFFIYLSHWEPHGPLAAREDRIRYFAEKLDRRIEDENVRLRAARYEALSEPSERQRAATYAAMIEQLDISTGRVMAALEALNLEENTIVIFTSDNGGTTHSTSNYPLRDGKGTFYEGGIRTPFAIKWPAVIKPGSKSDIAINGIDLMPTFAELASVPLPAAQPVDGLSILPLLKGNEDTFDKERPMFFHFPLYLGGRGAPLPVYQGQEGYWRAVPLSVIMKGDYKLIYYYEYETFELFNLREDISEQHDLSEQRPEVARALLKELHAWVRDNDAPVPDVPNPYFDPSQP